MLVASWPVSFSAVLSIVPIYPVSSWVRKPQPWSTSRELRPRARWSISPAALQCVLSSIALHRCELQSNQLDFERPVSTCNTHWNHQRQHSHLRLNFLLQQWGWVFLFQCFSLPVPGFSLRYVVSAHAIGNAALCTVLPIIWTFLLVKTLHA